MIVQRVTHKVKQGCMEELVALGNSFIESTGRTVRRYTPNVGRFDTLVGDHEFEGLAEMEKFWAEWHARPDTPAFMEKWFALTETGGTTEIWNLVG